MGETHHTRNPNFSIHAFQRLFQRFIPTPVGNIGPGRTGEFTQEPQLVSSSHVIGQSGLVGADPGHFHRQDFADAPGFFDEQQLFGFDEFAQMSLVSLGGHCRGIDSQRKYDRRLKNQDDETFQDKGSLNREMN